MYLKRYRKLFIGIIVGMLCVLPAGALAGNSLWVSALIDGDIAFQFDGQREILPAGYSVLLYENRTYVPARFVAERLGASVGWDQMAKIVKIDTGVSAEYRALQSEKQELEKVVVEKQEKINAQEKEIKELKAKLGEMESSTKGQPAGNYQKLPLARVLPDMNISVTGYFIDDYSTRVYLEIENKKLVPLQLVQSKTKAIVDGETYKTSDIMHYTVDQRWYHNIDHEEIQEGYLMLPLIPEDATEMMLEMTILYNDAKQETTTVEFYIRLDS